MDRGMKVEGVRQAGENWKPRIRRGPRIEMGMWYGTKMGMQGRTDGGVEVFIPSHNPLRYCYISLLWTLVDFDTGD